jgi:RHH-type proline utilization regulon transcriptional repressor/proline dehydrogenase/delta 1-pyrroline-5-carboxylate dehydrogenase
MYPQRPDPLRSVAQHVNEQYLDDEGDRVRECVRRAALSQAATDQILDDARSLVRAMRANREHMGGLDAFLSEYSLSSHEGVVLMCLAEALLRIPDAETADRLIADKLGEADFEKHLGASESLFVNTATWALMLTGDAVRHEELAGISHPGLFRDLLTRLGEPVIRTAMRQAMRIMGHEFVMGRTIEDALDRARDSDNRAYRFSFDMLGEAALSAADAQRYFEAYAHAIDCIGGRIGSNLPLVEAPSVSVKLSALSPRLEVAQAERALPPLIDKLAALARRAREANITLTIDAEESSRLELTLAVFEAVFADSGLKDWEGLGLAVQTYQKRAPRVIDFLLAKSRSAEKRISVRLVKGAYWDTEIKLAQQQGLAGYPVYTRKLSTDVAYLACARQLIEAAPRLYPQFATHNAHTAAWVMNVGAEQTFEFQRLHGMGEELYTEIIKNRGRPCRVYAPVGAHRDLLPYLVRRLLENGANTSFVNRFVDDEIPVEEFVTDPVDAVLALGRSVAHPRIPLPADLYGESRTNSMGLNGHDPLQLDILKREIERASGRDRACAIIDGMPVPGEPVEVRNPAAKASIVGHLELATASASHSALEVAHRAFPAWRDVTASDRSDTLRRASDLLEARRAELTRLCVLEGGKTIPDSLAEIREAVDFLRYYAAECERLFASEAIMPGPTGERNVLRATGRGVFLCISPWNFPVAIFSGQVAAALAAGNTVIAKPAEQTSIVAHRIVELLHDAGVPADALQFLPGRGQMIGDALLPDPRIAGVAFTGSTETAKVINRTLAARSGPIAALIAETGGINAMIVDSSALLEQVVRDVLRSAFNSAGQRCSALRLLCLPHDTADDTLDMLAGAMAELVIGDPALIETDVGPVIDEPSRERLLAYCEAHASRVLYRCELPASTASGLFVPPTVIALDSAEELREEVFGPVLHVVRYDPDEVDRLIEAIGTVGYGLTLGVHSRIGSFARAIAARARVGNVYVNRDMVGAVVGVQPFGGRGESGTGPKAGGPNYLSRFATEQTITTNTAAIGGNATLLSMDAGD